MIVSAHALALKNVATDRINADHIDKIVAQAFAAAGNAELLYIHLEKPASERGPDDIHFIAATNTSWIRGYATTPEGAEVAALRMRVIATPLTGSEVRLLANGVSYSITTTEMAAPYELGPTLDIAGSAPRFTSGHASDVVAALQARW